MKQMLKIGLLALFATGSLFAQSLSQSPAQAPVSPEKSAVSQALAPAAPSPLRGVENFGKITELLYRGAQPSSEGFANLKKLGIDIIVNLRGGGEGSHEEPVVQRLGMRYVDIPWNSIHSPSNQQVAEFLQLVRANPDKKIFVHCREGRDRTGVMIAAFRIAEQHWNAAQAVGEMHTFHFHDNFWFRSWKEYVKSFPGLFSSDPLFAALRAGAATATAASAPSSPK